MSTPTTTSSTAATTRAAAARTLARLCDTTPKAYPDWSYQTVMAFKVAVKKARGVSRNARASLQVIQEQTRALEVFHAASEVQP